MKKEQRFRGEPPYTEVKRPGESSPMAESRVTHMVVKMQAFLALGREILLLRGEELGELPMEELSSMMRKHLAPLGERAKERDWHGGFVATTGVLGAIPVDKEEGWKCKVQTCTEEHHCLPNWRKWT
jgi:hypothetical protein